MMGEAFSALELLIPLAHASGEAAPRQPNLHPSEAPCGAMVDITPLMPAGSPRLPEEDRWQRVDCYALVIGITSYDHMPNLVYAAKDARAMAALFRDKLDYKPPPSEVAGNGEQDATSAIQRGNVTLLEGAVTRQEIKQELDRLRGRIEREDHVLVYFAGHGQVAEVGGAPGPWYLLASDSDPAQLTRTALLEEELEQQLATLAASNVALILDACKTSRQDGSRIPTSRGAQPPHVDKDPTPFKPKRAVFTVLYAAQDGEAAYEAGGDIQGGFLTRALLATWPEAREGSHRDGYITLDDLIEGTRHRVHEWSHGRQNPYLEANGYGFILGPSPEQRMPRLVLPTEVFEISVTLDGQTVTREAPLTTGAHQIEVKWSSKAWIHPLRIAVTIDQGDADIEVQPYLDRERERLTLKPAMLAGGGIRVMSGTVDPGCSAPEDFDPDPTCSATEVHALPNFGTLISTHWIPLASEPLARPPVRPVLGGSIFVGPAAQDSQDASATLGLGLDLGLWWQQGSFVVGPAMQLGAFLPWTPAPLSALPNAGLALQVGWLDLRGMVLLDIGVQSLTYKPSDGWQISESLMPVATLSAGLNLRRPERTP